MTKSAVNKIMEGLDDALAFAQGDTSRAIVHTVTVPTVDVRAIRAETKLSRPKFAERFGLDARAIQDWEQGSRVPDRAAQVLLRAIRLAPDVIARAAAE